MNNITCSERQEMFWLLVYCRHLFVDKIYLLKLLKPIHRFWFQCWNLRSDEYGSSANPCQVTLRVQPPWLVEMHSRYVDEVKREFQLFPAFSVTVHQPGPNKNQSLMYSSNNPNLWQPATNLVLCFLCQVYCRPIQELFVTTTRYHACFTMRLSEFSMTVWSTMRTKVTLTRFLLRWLRNTFHRCEIQIT